MVLAVGTCRALRALPKANRPREGVFHRQRQKAIQQAGMAIFPCAAGLCSFIHFYFTLHFSAHSLAFWENVLC